MQPAYKTRKGSVDLSQLENQVWAQASKLTYTPETIDLSKWQLQDCTWKQHKELRKIKDLHSCIVFSLQPAYFSQ